MTKCYTCRAESNGFLFCKSCEDSKTRKVPTIIQKGDGWTKERPKNHKALNGII